MSETNIARFADLVRARLGRQDTVTLHYGQNSAIVRGLVAQGLRVHSSGVDCLLAYTRVSL